MMDRTTLAARLAACWNDLWTAARAGVAPVDEPIVALQAGRRATTTLAAVAAHAALSRSTGWPSPRSLVEVTDQLATVLPEGWALLGAIQEPTVPSLPEAAQLMRDNVRDGNWDLSDIYEMLLAFDWRTGTNSHQHQRRSLGAFHTPTDLADALVARTMTVVARDRLGHDVVLEDPATVRFLASLSVADLAVGGGRFPVAWLRLLGQLSTQVGVGTEPVLESFSRLELTDVDRIALEIAAIATAVEVGSLGTLREGGPRLRFGNALLAAPERQAPASRRAELLEHAHLWHPEVGVADPGPVDLVIGNPPWERVRVEQRSLLRGLLDQVAHGSHKASRQQALDCAYVRHPRLAEYLEDHLASTVAGVAALRRDPRLQLSTKGEIYTHALFTELAVRRTEPRQGWVALLVKSALLTSVGHRHLSRWLLDAHRVAEVWDFRNSNRVFDIDSRERFAALIMGPPRPGGARLASGLTEVAQLGAEETLALIDDDTRRRLSPGHQVLPATVGSDLTLLLELGDLPTLREAHPEARFGRLLHLTNHSSSIHQSPGSGRLPVWEGRMIEQWTRRFATWDGVHGSHRWGAKTRARPANDAELADPDFEPEARWWVDADRWEQVASGHREPYSLVWRNASSPFNRRTLLATVLPRVPTIQSVQLLQLPDPRELLCLCATLNSLVVDWVVRRRMPGIDVTGTFVGQLPVPGPGALAQQVLFDGVTARLSDHIAFRAAALLSGDRAMGPLLSAAQLDVAPVTDCRRRTQRELDVLVAHAFGLDGKALGRIAADFPADLTSAERDGLADGTFGVVG